MNEPTHRDTFLSSLQRCAESSDFIPSFYQRFMAKSDRIREKFKDTAFAKQSTMLLQSLRLAAGATDGVRESLHEIRERAITHDRHHLDIQPPLYEHWLSAAIETAAEFDREWNTDVNAAWTAILTFVVNYMSRRY